MISLERLLDGLEVEVEPFVVHDLRSRCTPACGPSKPTIRYTQSGAGALELAGGAILRFSRQAVMVLPARRRPPLARAARREGEAAPGDPEVATACGQIRATYQESMGLFDDLREPLVESLAANDAIHQSFDDLRDEIATLRPGSRAMVETLVRRCLILLLRRCFRHADCRESWLAGLEDVRLGRAVAAMQERPHDSFTLRTLAEVAGMSRSVFAARFADALGQSPIEFLKILRLARASQLLISTDLAVKTVAARVGYSSRSSFSRAFVARHGVGPTAFRGAAREPTAGPWGPGGAAHVA